MTLCVHSGAWIRGLPRPHARRRGARHARARVRCSMQREQVRAIQSCARVGAPTEGSQLWMEGATAPAALRAVEEQLPALRALQSMLGVRGPRPCPLVPHFTCILVCVEDSRTGGKSDISAATGIGSEDLGTFCLALAIISLQ